MYLKKQSIQMKHGSHGRHLLRTDVRPGIAFRLSQTGAHVDEQLGRMYGGVAISLKLP